MDKSVFVNIHDDVIAVAIIFRTHNFRNIPIVRFNDIHVFIKNIALKIIAYFIMNVSIKSILPIDDLPCFNVNERSPTIILPN